MNSNATNAFRRMAKSAERSCYAEADHGAERTELVFAALSGGLLLLGWFVSRAVAQPAWLSWACFVAAYVFGGFCAFREAFEKLGSFRLEIDLLMLVAAVGAATLGAWAEGALLLFLFSLGHAMERYAMGRATRAIQALGKLAPQVATVRRGDLIEELAVDRCADSNACHGISMPHMCYSRGPRSRDDSTLL